MPTIEQRIAAARQLKDPRQRYRAFDQLWHAAEAEIMQTIRAEKAAAVRELHSQVGGNDAEVGRQLKITKQWAHAIRVGHDGQKARG
jgi:hypothetical protein